MTHYSFLFELDAGGRCASPEGARGPHQVRLLLRHSARPRVSATRALTRAALERRSCEHSYEHSYEQSHEQSHEHARDELTPIARAPAAPPLTPHRRYVENQSFAFDQVLDEHCDNEVTYQCTAKPLIPFVFSGRRASCFAYGQTGSGKTFTMAGEDDIIGVYQLIARDIFASQAAKRKEIELTVHVSYFEIYGGMVYDLLSNRERLRVLENGKGQVVVRRRHERVLFCSLECVSPPPLHFLTHYSFVLFRFVINIHHGFVVLVS